VGWQPSQYWTTEAKPNAPFAWPDWVRDVTFAEDTSQVHTRTAPQVMPCLRNLAIGLLSRVGPVGLAAPYAAAQLLTTGGYRKASGQPASADSAAVSRSAMAKEPGRAAGSVGCQSGCVAR
jgi:hypothetical protein